MKPPPDPDDDDLDLDEWEYQKPRDSDGDFEQFDVPLKRRKKIPLRMRFGEDGKKRSQSS